MTPQEERDRVYLHTWALISNVATYLDMPPALRIAFEPILKRQVTNWLAIEAAAQKKENAARDTR